MGEGEIISITFTASGPISSGVLDEEAAEALRQMVANQPCDVYWGSHGCDLKRDHDGWHICQDEDEDEPHSSVSSEGVDESGFQWSPVRGRCPLTDLTDLLSADDEIIDWALTCYGNVYSYLRATATAAKSAQESHIRNCPEGAMPWADPIKWREVEGDWVSAANGEWLSHHARRRDA